MKAIRTWAGIVLIVGGAVGGYALAVAARTSPASTERGDTATEALLGWLDASPQQRTQLSSRDPSFAIDLQNLRTELSERRGDFAAALENTTASSETIRERSERVIAASAALERRVVAYLLAVRDQLSASQQRQLFGLCAETIRQGGGHQWRHGQQGGPWRGGGRGGPSRGGGFGRGGPPHSQTGP